MNDLIERAKALQADGKTQPEIALELGCSKSMVGLYLNPERMEKHRAAAREYSKRPKTPEHRKRIAASRADYQRRTRDARNAYQRARYAKSPALKLYMNAYRENRIKTDPQFRARHNYRIWFFQWWALGIKTRDAEMRELVGCSRDEFKAHLASQFKDGQSWGNYGRDGLWVVDHIKPLFTFDMTTVEGRKQAMHFSNVRPLHPSLNSGRERREKLFMQGKLV